jgi:hypothetical protein
VRIKYTKVEYNHGNVTLYVYLNDVQTEFSEELGSTKEVPIALNDEIRKVVQSKYTNIKINAVKIVVGTIMVAGFPFQQLQVKAQAACTYRHTNIAPNNLSLTKWGYII